MKKIETLTKNVSELQKNFPNWYGIESFIRDAKQYIKAIKERRMIVNIASVSKSGMTRRMVFNSCEKNKRTKNCYYRQYTGLFTALGTFTVKNHEIVVGGCGMDMVFHVNYTTIHKLHKLGFITRKECDILAQITPQII